MVHGGGNALAVTVIIVVVCVVVGVVIIAGTETDMNVQYQTESMGPDDQERYHEGKHKSIGELKILRT